MIIIESEYSSGLNQANRNDCEIAAVGGFDHEALVLQGLGSIYTHDPYAKFFERGDFELRNED